MFRLAPTEGDIILDDTPSSAIPLEILRRKLSVIPQDPVLFRFDLAVIGIDAKLIAPTQWVSPSKLGPL
jgi:ABC-type transport system involved in Fe-S cluster assembly fused permease/ATPase subunit